MSIDDRERGRVATRAELRAELPRAGRAYFEGALCNPRLAIMDLQSMTLAPAVCPQVRRLSEARLAEELSVAPLGRRVAVARRASRATLKLLLGETEAPVVGALLSNPRVVEEDVVTLAASTRAAVEALETIAIHPDWGQRLRVRRALLANERVGIRVALGLVQRMAREELELLSTVAGFPAIVSIAVRRRLASPAAEGMR